MAKPSCCKCGTYRQTRGERWVVIAWRLGKKSVRLKCLDCGWKWYSTARYAQNLPSHTERSRSGMTDQDILDRIKDGSLVVNQDTAIVVSITDRGSRILSQIERTSNGSTYRFVTVCSGGLKKKITVHRLVWMAANLRTVPPGHDIDHINGKQGRYPDAIGNLRLLGSSTNRRRGYVSPTPALPFEDTDEAPF